MLVKPHGLETPAADCTLIKNEVVLKQVQPCGSGAQKKSTRSAEKTYNRKRSVAKNMTTKAKKPIPPTRLLFIYSSISSFRHNDLILRF